MEDSREDTCGCGECCEACWFDCCACALDILEYAADLPVSNCGFTPQSQVDFLVNIWAPRNEQLELDAIAKFIDAASH